jgi:hypothetical protein
MINLFPRKVESLDLSLRQILANSVPCADADPAEPAYNCGADVWRLFQEVRPSGRAHHALRVLEGKSREI